MEWGPIIIIGAVVLTLLAMFVGFTWLAFAKSLWWLAALLLPGGITALIIAMVQGATSWQ